MTDFPSPNRRAAILVLLGMFLASAGLAQNPRRAADGPRIWWNQERFVTGLALTSEQRGAMDAVLKSHLETRREKGKAYQAARAVLTEAARAGNWPASEAASLELGEAGGELARLEGELVVGVMRLLTAEQRAKLGEDFPMILRRPWLFGGRGPARPGHPSPPG